MKRGLSLLFVIMMTLSFSVTAFAANDNDIIPADDGEKVFVASSSASDQSSKSQSETDPNSSSSSSIMTPPPKHGDKEPEVAPPKDYTSGIFYAPTLDIDKSEAEPINANVRRVASFIISVVINILPLGIVIFTLVDIMCLLFPPILWFMANIMPLQLYSPEVVSITGVAFGGKEGGGGGGAKADLDGKNPIFFYAQQRVGVIFVALLIVVLMVSGIWWTIMSWLINLIVGWMMSLV